MLRRIKSYLIFLVFSACFLPNQLIAQERYLNLNDIKWPPFFFPQLESSNTGVAKDILAICINEMDYNIHYKSLPIKRTHLYMKSGELDVSVYSFKKSREEFVVYGKEPIFVSKYGFASRAADNIEIKSVDDIYKYKFGHLAGLAHTPELMKVIEDKRITDEVSEGYDLDAMFGQLLATPQRFQVMANSTETFRWRAKQLGIGDEVKVHDFVLRMKPYFVSVSKFSKNIEDITLFLKEMDQCLASIKQDGRYEKITSIYGLSVK